MTSETNARVPALAARRVAIDTWRENVAFLRRDCPVVRAEGFQPLSKVQIDANGRRITAVVNVVDDPRLLGECELGLSEQAFAQLGVTEGAEVQVAHAEPPASASALRRKLMGERLSRHDLKLLVADIAARRYTKIELAAFVVATQQVEMDRDEVLHLTEAMAAVGQRLTWPSVGGQPARIVDKHCIGGIPGNRTSMIVVPIVAVHAQRAGFLVPKTSSRAITSPAGTADTMACLADVELPLERMQQVVAAHSACLAWGGRAQLSPADDVLISVSRPLSIDAPGQMVASILSKKIAAGATHLLLDIPVGPTSKVHSAAAAQHLRQLFEYVAGHLGLTLEVMLTDGRQPVGHGIGPVLEARDVVRVLCNDPRAPADLRTKSLQLAARLLEFDPALRGGDGERMAEEILASGRAWAKMQDIIAAQGARPFDAEHPPLAPLTHEVAAMGDGLVVAIDNERLARIARLAGAPKARGAGIDLLHKLGARVTRGAPLYRIHAGSAAELMYAQQTAQRASGFTIDGASSAP